MSISLEPTHTIDVDYHELCGALAAKSMQPLWRINRELVTNVPLPSTRAWMWKWDMILTLAKRAGEVVPIDRGGDRRVLALANPGLNGLPFTSTSLWGAVQYLGPHERAPAHRHTPGAIRFVLAGSGATTTVAGDVCTMNEGDLVLTPNWSWHEHHSESDDAVVWFDGLDLPIATTLEAIFFENHPADFQRPVGRDCSQDAFSGSGLRELDVSSPAGRSSSLLRYPWEATDRMLSALLKSASEPIVSVEFTDPLTGGPAMPTLGCEMHRLRPGERTASHRHTGSTIFVAFRGAGATVVDGQRFEWQAGDILVSPSWAVVDHEASVPSDMFALTDRPILQTLGLYRSERLAQRQTVTSQFEPATFDDTTPTASRHPDVAPAPEGPPSAADPAATRLHVVETDAR
jgi:gentisate 1,2-dioxygenase